MTKVGCFINGIFVGILIGCVLTVLGFILGAH